MPVIREVVTKFGIEVDKKGAKSVEQRVNGLKVFVGKVGVALGLALGTMGGKAMAKMGQSAERAEWNLERLAGVKFDVLRDHFKKVRDDLNAIKEDAGGVISEKQFDIAAAGFLRVFGKSEKQIEAFKNIFTFAAKQAAITGVEVTSIVEQIQSAIQGGGFDALLDLPGFDIFRNKILEFQQQAIDPGEPGGKIALANRLKAISKIIVESTEDQNKELSNIPEILLKTDAAATKTKDNLERLAKSINKTLVPAIDLLNKALDKFNDLIEVGQGAKTPAGFLENVIREIINPAERPTVAEQAPAPPASVAFPAGLAPTTGASFTIENKFIIPNADPFAVAKIVGDVMSEQVKTAADNIKWQSEE